MSIQLLSNQGTTNAAPALSYAAGTIAAVAGASLVNGETFTIRNGQFLVVFQFFSAGSVATSDTLRGVAFTGGDTAATVAATMVTAINAAPFAGTLASAVGANLTVTKTRSGPNGNGAITDTVANAGFTHADFTGGSLAGFDLRRRMPGNAGSGWSGQDWGEIVVKSTAGSGTMTWQGRLWLYDLEADFWAPAGISSTSTSRGLLNGGTTIAEEGADQIVHRENVVGLSGPARIYLQQTVNGGVAATFDAWLMERSVSG